MTGCVSNSTIFLGKLKLNVLELDCSVITRDVEFNL